MKNKKGWIITNSHIDEIERYEPKIGNIYKNKPVNIIGPNGCELSIEELKKGFPFKMFDDDSNLYYEGFLVGDKYGHDGFMPLDHYGTPNAGCTSIQYQNENKEWFTL